MLARPIGDVFAQPVGERNRFLAFRRSQFFDQTDEFQLNAVRQFFGFAQSLFGRLVVTTEQAASRADLHDQTENLLFDRIVQIAGNAVALFGHRQFLSDAEHRLQTFRHFIEHPREPSDFVRVLLGCARRKFAFAPGFDGERDAVEPLRDLVRLQKAEYKTANCHR